MLSIIDVTAVLHAVGAGSRRRYQASQEQDANITLTHI